MQSSIAFDSREHAGVKDFLENIPKSLKFLAFDYHYFDSQVMGILLKLVTSKDHNLNSLIISPSSCGIEFREQLKRIIAEKRFTSLTLGGCSNNIEDSLLQLSTEAILANEFHLTELVWITHDSYLFFSDQVLKFTDAILASSPNPPLKSLHILWAVIGVDEMTQFTRLFHILKSFRVNNIGPGAWKKLAEGLLLPGCSLESLSIVGTPISNLDDFKKFLEALGCSTCPLKEVNLDFLSSRGWQEFLMPDNYVMPIMESILSGSISTLELVTLKNCVVSSPINLYTVVAEDEDWKESVLNFHSRRRSRDNLNAVGIVVRGIKFMLAFNQIEPFSLRPEFEDAFPRIPL